MICITAKNFIDGGWKEPADCFESRNPADRREVVGTAPASTEKDVERAVEAAARAWDRWRSLAPVKRAEPIDNLAQVLKRYGREIGKYITLETGKPLAESAAEVQEALTLAQRLVGLAGMPHGQVVAARTPDEDCYALRRPRGVMACVTPSFAPLAGPLRFVLAALLEGNTVVWKPSDKAVAVSQYVSRLFLEAGFLEGAVDVIYGQDPTVLRALVQHPTVAGVFFGGTRQTEQDLRMVLGLDQTKLLCVETYLPGACVVLEDAEIPLAVEATVKSAFTTAGRRFNSVDRVFVRRTVLDEFVDALKTRVAAMSIGPGIAPGVELGPLPSPDDLARMAAVRDCIEPSIDRVICSPALPEGEATSEGCFAAPFVWQAKSADGCLPSEPARCPCLGVVPVDGVEEAVAAMLNTMALAVFTRNRNAWRRVRDSASYRRGFVNLPTVGGLSPSAGASTLEDIMDAAIRRTPLAVGQNGTQRE